MFDAQKKMLKAMANNDPMTVYYFPRAMGKTYVLKFIKKLGQSATKPQSGSKGDEE